MSEPEKNEYEGLEVCANCKFYFKAECRRYPRTLVLEHKGYYDDLGKKMGPYFESQYPDQEPDDTCGEFKEKP